MSPPPPLKLRRTGPRPGISPRRKTRNRPPKPRRRRNHEEVLRDRRPGMAGVLPFSARLRDPGGVPRDEWPDLLRDRVVLERPERAEGAGPAVPLHEHLLLDLQSLHRADHRDAPFRRRAQERDDRDPPDLPRDGDRGRARQVDRRPRLLPDALGSHAHLRVDPALAGADRPRAGRLGLPRDHASRGVFPLGRDVRLDVDEEPDRRRDPHLRDADPDLLRRAPRNDPERPEQAGPPRLLQPVGSYGRVRARHRGQPADRLVRLGDGLLPVLRRRRTDGEEGAAMSRARNLRAGTSAAAIALVFALVAGVNYLSARHWVRGDWTKTKIYSLSQTTRKVVAGLTKPVQVTVFMTRNSRLHMPVSEVLNRYRTASPKIEVEFLDPERNPMRAQELLKQFGIRQNTVVFRSGDRKKYVEEDKIADFDYTGMQQGAVPQIKTFKGEEAFTSAILDVTEKTVSKIYFSTGHGEPKLDSQERGQGFGQLTVSYTHLRA